ncbi:serine hydrolase [Corynebacterium sp. HS2168-gen11]|uniref:serine hydrolase domain-containing protein n=1 Tax=Corynebacterium sp. HS2168-gen11 TaxID=2974027 RepID=UPI00216AF96B|nr:serine hydrolase domain-containing protein [Corynebacterium sp. HS2168-gen11]MCS4535429.1 beta-lactamase family protein [Corynebacterium sp. HS2168-gen11]
MNLEHLHTWPVLNVAGAVRRGTAITTTGDLDREYQLASVTKLLATYGVLIAIEEGVFELDTPIFEQATVRHLLAHAGGVGFHRTDPIKGIETRRIYSSYGFELLGDAIAAETEMSFAEYLHEAVFAPLGMQRTKLWGSPGHEATSTVRDLLLFADEILAPQLLAESTLAAALEVQFPTLDGIVPGYGMHKPCQWGLGFEIHGHKQPHWLAPNMPADVVGHFGQAGTFVWVHRPTQQAAVVLTDRPFGPWAKPLWDSFNGEIFQAEVE